MIIMDSVSGQVLEELEAVKKVIKDILITPIGTRIMRRDYGSKLFFLLDHPVDSALVLKIQGTVAEALTAALPDLTLTAVKLKPTYDNQELKTNFLEGCLKLEIQGFYQNKKITAYTSLFKNEQEQ